MSIYLSGLGLIAFAGLVRSIAHSAPHRQADLNLNQTIDYIGLMRQRFPLRHSNASSISYLLFIIFEPLFGLISISANEKTMLRPI